MLKTRGRCLPFAAFVRFLEVCENVSFIEVRSAYTRKKIFVENLLKNKILLCKGDMGNRFW